MREIEYRECRKEDIENLVELRNNIFPPVTVEDLQKEENMTASVGVMDGEIVGAIFLDLRQFLIAPRVTITAAFENCVGVREDLRRQGVGRNMMTCAKEFLKDRCDAMMVYTGGEGQGAYMFYAKTGHFDLHYGRLVKLENPQKMEHNVVISEIEEIYCIENEIFEVFDSTYGQMAGFPKRYPGYWKKALNAFIYAALLYDFTLFRLYEGNELKGYVIGGVRREKWKDDTVHILEMATEEGNESYGFQLLKGVCHFAAENNLQVAMQNSTFHPYMRVFSKLSFSILPRRFVLAGLLLRPKEILEKLLLKNEELEGFPKSLLDFLGALEKTRIKVWTPTQELVLKEADGSVNLPAIGREEMTLEMKEETLTRLVLSRLDLMNAIEEERITVLNGNEKTIRALAESIPVTKWVYHSIDYI